MSKKSQNTTDALAILDEKYFKDDPEALTGIAHEEEKCAIAARIYEWRHQAGMSQKALAGKIGTTSSVISRFENMLEDSYTVATLKKIAFVLGHHHQEFFEEKTFFETDGFFLDEEIEDNFRNFKQIDYACVLPDWYGEEQGAA